MDKYQISDGFNSKDIAIDWEKLSQEMIDNISGDYFYNILSYTKDNQVETKTVIFFRKVSKFRKGITSFEHEGIEFGVE